MVYQRTIFSNENLRRLIIPLIIASLSRLLWDLQLPHYGSQRRGKRQFPEFR